MSEAAEKRPIGRPPVHGPEVYHAILERLADGELLRDICSEPGQPKPWTVIRHADADPDFGALYARAREMQSHAHAEMALLEARGSTPADAQSQRLKFDAEKWMAAKLNPAKYGDKTLHVGGDGEGPIRHALALDYSALSDDELLTLRALLAKAGGVVPEDPKLIEGEAGEVEG